MMIRQLRTLVVLFFFLTLCSIGYSQSAQLQGQVTDSSGAIIPGAQIRVVDQRTATERRTETNGHGEYAIPALNPSIYKIFIEASGFNMAISNAITLSVAQTAVHDFKLQAGAVSSEVAVNADDSNINTTDGSVSTVIDRQFAENLPINGRSFQSLISLSPGVVSNAGSAASYHSQGGFVVNGQRGDANYWMVDGVSANIGMSLALPGASMAGAVAAASAVGGTSALVSVDDLQEFRIETSTYASEFGREPGAQISIQTRSGTNQFHGTLFEYLRNGDLDAKDWFADRDGLPKPLEIQNDFGGTLGGPILKGKTFFFLSAEGLRLKLPQTFLGTVPDMASRAKAIPAMRPYLNMYPLPQPGAITAGPGYVAYNGTFSEPGSADAYSLRIDHQLLKQLNLFARFNYAPSSIKQRGADNVAANTFATTTTVTKTGTVGATWVVSAHVLDDLRFNYSVSGGRSIFNSDSFGGGTPFPSANLFGGNLTYDNAALLLLPVFGANMYQAHGLWAEGFQRQYNLVDSLSVQRASHSLKFGVDYRRLNPTTNWSQEELQPIFTNMAALMTGNTYATDIQLNSAESFLLHNLSTFAQDNWRVNSRLTLNYGLRWDIDFVPSTQRGLGFAVPVTGFNTSNLSNLALAPTGMSPYKTRYGNIAPRLGAAYRLSVDPDWGTVLRGGFGVYYGLASTEMMNINLDEGDYPAGSFSYSANAAFPTNPAAVKLPAPQIPSITNGETLFAFDPNLNLPYALEWSAVLEQSLGKTQTFALSYIGAANRRQLLSELIKNPNPQFAFANLIVNAGAGNYQALQAQFQRRMANGLQVLASYSWSHSIDNGSSGAYTAGSLADFNANRGDSDNDIRHVFSGAVTYVLPTAKRNLVTRAITGGWSTDDIVQVHSGAPIDIQDVNVTDLSVKDSVFIRPDVVPGQPLYLTGSQYPGRKALNPAAFKDPPRDPMTGLPTRQGNLSRNARRSLGLMQWDFAAHREFSIYERVRLQFRAELFNILNHPNLGPFNNQLQTGNIYFGQSTQMLNQFLEGKYSGQGNQNALYTPGSPRSGEFALKILF